MEMRPFQIILLGVFIALAFGGLILFSVFRGFGSEPNPFGASVEIWGTFDWITFNAVITELSDADDNFRVVSYRQMDPRTFRAELVSAIAEGRGPDAIVLASDELVSERAKLYPIPYASLSARTIQDTYVDGVEVFARADGVYGFPIAVDPLVMYWNRDLFASAGLVTPPATWETLTASVVPALTRIEQSPVYTVSKSAIAFGEYTNVTNAADIMYLLALQAGSGMVVENASGYEVALNRSVGQTARSPLDAALDFYTQFSNPSRPNYTWNRSLPQDRSAFLAADLALYFDYGSAAANLSAGNPNLRFDAAPVPQGSGATVKKGLGTFYSLAVLRTSDNFAGTYRAVSLLGSQEPARALAEGFGFAPVHRATLAAGNANPFRQTMYTEALIARGFLDPDPAASGSVIKTMIEDVTSGRMTISEAAGDAVGRFNQLLR